MIDDLPEDLASLFAEERAARAPAALRTVVRSKLVASAALAASSSTAAAAGGAAATAGMVSKVVVVLALALGGTTAALLATRREPESATATASAPTAATATVAATATAAATESGSAALPPAALPSAPTAIRVHPRRAPPPPPEPPISDAETLAHAWRVVSSDPDLALSLVTTATGDTLAEERDAIRCVALAHLHRPEAASAIAAFLSAHPRSLHRALLERAQKGLP